MASSLSRVDGALLFVAASWATTHSMIRVLLRSMTPFGMTALRFGLMMILAAAVLLWTRARIERKDMPRLTLAAMLSYGIYQIAYVLGIDKSGAFIGGVLISMVPVFTIALGVLTRTEFPSRRQTIATVAACLCVAGFVMTTRSPSGTTLLGASLSLIAAVLFAGYGIAIKPLAGKYPAIPLICAQVLIGGIPLLLIGGRDVLAQDWSLVSLRDWGYIAYLVLIPAFVSYGLWNWCIGQVGAAHTANFALLVPILASVVSIWTLREPFSAWSLIFAAGLLVCLAMARKSAAAEPVPEVG